MNIVIDSNALVALGLDDDRAPIVDRRLRAWRAAGDQLHAPTLMLYEAANALTRVVAAGKLDPADVQDTWDAIIDVPVMLHEVTDGPAVIAIAGLLQRRSAYDAAYLVLARELDGELWTFDGPLARNAASRGLPVRLMGEPSSLS